MSDDLISRMALVEEIEHSFIIPILKINLRSEHKAVLKIREIIMNMPTAFDKEKVIEELKSAENYLYVNGARITNFKFIHSLTAIEIVEKGGIE